MPNREKAWNSPDVTTWASLWMETSKSKMEPYPGEKFHWGPGDLARCVQPLAGSDYKGGNTYSPRYMWFVLFWLGSAWPLSISVGTYGRIEVILQVTQDVCSVSFIRPNWCPHWALSPTSATKHSSHPWMWKCTRMSGQMSYQTGLWDILLFYRAKGLLHCLKCFNMNPERQVEGKHTTNVHL